MTNIQEPTPERLSKSHGFTHMNEPGSKRQIRRLKTTLDLLEDRGQLRKELRTVFVFLASRWVNAYHYVTEERSTHNLVSSYQDKIDHGFGSNQPKLNDYQRASWKFVIAVEDAIPQGGELWPVYRQILDEEVGIRIGQPRPLKNFGKKRGFRQEQQARAAGASIAVDVCEIVYSVYQDMSGLLRK